MTMTRDEARRNLSTLGIAEPDETVVTNYLNQFHAQSKPEPNPEPTPKPPTNWSETQEYKDMQRQIEEMRNEGIKKDIRAYAAEKGLTGEQAETILSGFSVNLETAKAAIDSLATVITDRETAAAQRKEQEIANGSTAPNGGASGGEPQKTEAEKWVESYSKSLSDANATAQSIVDAYK